ncbi:MAG TPA: DUF1835 domain-containing protein [Pyrinomonadaceae bacterium]|nr:DUF1835 domain-containing protein [Pyrinomonadaceae bacterium]
MLHIVNGDSTATTLKRTKIKGEIFSFKDTLINGPAPATQNRNEWRAVRVQHLTDTYGLKLKECEKEFLKQEAALASAAKHDEVVLWFEYDLFCQLNLLYLLDWFYEADLKKTCLSLINIDSFPGRKDFRGLGELTEDELASLFPKREKVTKAQLELGAKAWQAFRSPNPTAIELLLHSDTSKLPLLAQALSAHLRRFPSTTNGLGQIEKSGLQIIADGYGKFIDMFPKFLAAEKTYGLGDSQVWATLINLGDGPNPLLKITNAPLERAVDPKTMKRAGFKLTKAGQSVLAGKDDFVKLNGMDQWLGGVHLENKKEMWRWHDPVGRLALVKN